MTSPARKDRSPPASLATAAARDRESQTLTAPVRLAIGRRGGHGNATRPRRRLPRWPPSRWAIALGSTNPVPPRSPSGATPRRFQPSWREWRSARRVHRRARSRGRRSELTRSFLSPLHSPDCAGPLAKRDCTAHQPVFKTGRPWQPQGWKVRFLRRSVASFAGTCSPRAALRPLPTDRQHPAPVQAASPSTGSSESGPTEAAPRQRFGVRGAVFDALAPGGRNRLGRGDTRGTRWQPRPRDSCAGSRVRRHRRREALPLSPRLRAAVAAVRSHRGAHGLGDPRRSSRTRASRACRRW